MGREAYHTLSLIPLDDLAANGESMASDQLPFILLTAKGD